MAILFKAIYRCNLQMQCNLDKNSKMIFFFTDTEETISKSQPVGQAARLNPRAGAASYQITVVKIQCELGEGNIT